MAYRPTNDIHENVIHRNTIFESQGMVSCCTCGYCINKTEDSTLTLTNFKAADPLINENSIGSTITEFSDYMIPSGSFEGYVLTPTYDSTTLVPYGFSTTSYNRLIPNKDTSNISSALSYYPFLNCSGATSISYWPGPEFDENGYRKRNVKTYGIETEGGILFISAPPKPPIQSNVVDNYYINSQYFGKKNYYHFEFSNNPLYSDNFSWFAPYISPGNCPFEEFKDIMSWYYSSSQFSPKSPPPSTSTGDITNLMNYVSTNEYSAFGFKPESSCTNNIVKVMNPIRFFDVSGYNFSYTHPSYSLVLSTPRIFPDSSTLYPNYFPSQFTQYLRSNFAFDPVTGDESEIYKDGYILGGFSLKSDGSFSSKLSLINIDKVYNSTISLALQLNSQVVQAYDNFRYYNCWAIYFIYQYDRFVASEPVLEGYAPIIGSAFSVPSATYNEQNIVSYYTNGYFIRDLIPSGSSFDFNFWGERDEVFFGRKLYEGDVYQKFYYPNQPALILDYNAVKTNRTQITSSTNSNGWTTVKIKNVLWVGKTLLTKTYEHDLGVNRPRLSIGAVPLRYDAILKGGFESDIEVGFQSIPLCKIQNIADKLSRITSLKVNFENYQKIPQQNMIGYDHLLSQFSASPAMEEIGNLIGPYGQIVDSYSYVPAFASFYVYGSINYQSPPFYSASDFENMGYFPPNENQYNDFVIKRYESDRIGFYRFDLIQKNIVPIDPPVLTSYIAFPGRVYPDFGIADRFKSCLLVNGDADVWKTGNEVQFVGLDYLVTDGGSGYTSVPTVTLSNGGGTGATAYARISNGKVISVTVGNKGKDYTSNKTVVISGGGGNGATAVDISFTPFYSIYMEEIKDEKQTAGQSLIRIAKTLQDANNGVYIPNVGLETLYKDRSLSVKFLYGFKEVSVENLPRYKNANRNLASTFNENAERINAYYYTEGECYNSFTSKFNFSFRSDGYFDISFTQDINVQGQYSYMNIGSYLTHGSRDALASYSNFVPNQNIVNSFPEIITLSPLKIKYRNVRFDDFDGSYFFMSYQRTAQQPYLVPVTYVTNFNSWDYGITRVALYGVGFQCDIVLEEIVDEFIQEALPVEFNQILENVEYIQTSNLMNSRTPMEMINPEQCDHIGKVIDRKDCNCPKKWVRLCDVHGKTDWKNCMQCKDFKVSE